MTTSLRLLLVGALLAVMMSAMVLCPSQASAFTFAQEHDPSNAQEGFHDGITLGYQDGILRCTLFQFPPRSQAPYDASFARGYWQGRQHGARVCQAKKGAIHPQQPEPIQLQQTPSPLCPSRLAKTARP